MDGRGVVSPRRGMRRVAAEGVIDEGRVRGDFRQRHRREQHRHCDKTRRRQRRRASIAGGRRATTTSVARVYHLRWRVRSTACHSVYLCHTNKTRSLTLSPAAESVFEGRRLACDLRVFADVDILFSRANAAVLPSLSNRALDQSNDARRSLR